MSSINTIFIDKLNGVSLDDILQNHLAFTWTDAGVAESRYSGNGLSSKDIRDASTNRFTESFTDILNSKVEPLVTEYANKHGVFDLKNEGYHIVKYTKGQFFAEHTDATPEYPRRMSAIVYLNDNYEGGTITFTNINKSFKPEENTIMIFPSSKEFSHSADPVISGTKYAIIGFWL
jgi:Rps23 Pro-64 3,4-dihydroxylase Tpa1-like proline 4-hydroxylase